MLEDAYRFVAGTRRVKSVLLVVCALILFVAGLLLLLAPAAAQDQSRRGQHGSPFGADRWIMSAQSSEPVLCREDDWGSRIFRTLASGG